MMRELWVGPKAPDFTLDTGDGATGFRQVN